MKILWVKPGKLLPLHTGGQLRTYNILRQLSATHDLTYLSFYGGSGDKAYEQEIVSQIPGTVVKHTRALNEAKPIDYLRRFPSHAPYAVTKFTAPEVQDLLAQWIPQHRFDVAVCDFLCTVLNFPKNLTTPTALFQHNVESVLWKRKAELEAKRIDRLIAKVEYAKMRRFEPAQVRRFHHVIAVSEQDRRAMSWMCDLSHISVVPTGVDLAKYKYDPNVGPDGALVVFTGSMDWEANIDGVEYFCKEIWPRVLAEAPLARFRIVGRDPHPRVKRLASDSVEVTGTVSSIIDHMRQAAVLVVPLRIGGGTRIKIYEGLAMGKATVSTSVGAEGLDVEHGRDILLEDDPISFADAIVHLLRDVNLRQKYEAAAAATSRQYDWSMIAARFAEVLEKTIRVASSTGVVSPQIEAVGA
jgi:polysaccharide biosynthesis protein PslH